MLGHGHDDESVCTCLSAILPVCATQVLRMACVINTWLLMMFQDIKLTPKVFSFLFFSSLFFSSRRFPCKCCRHARHAQHDARRNASSHTSWQWSYKGWQRQDQTEERADQRFGRTSWVEMMTKWSPVQIQIHQFVCNCKG